MKTKTSNSKLLAAFRGRLVLAGAGKMGGAMLDGWLTRGLEPKNVSVIEPEPSKAIKALARRGLTSIRSVSAAAPPSSSSRSSRKPPPKRCRR